MSILYRSAQYRLLVGLLLSLALVLSACGGGADPTPTPIPPAAAPLAQEAPTATPEPMPTDTPAPEPEEVAPTAEEESTGALFAAIDEYLSSIPEGYMAVGRIDAFQEILASGAVVLIDVREEGEYGAGHIEGAINIPIRTLAQNLDMVPADMPVLIYCASGHRAGLATSVLRTLGYDNVRSFPPGWRGWTVAEEAVSTDPVAGETYEVPAIDAELVAAADAFLSGIPEGYYAMGTADALAQAMDAGAVVVDVREESEFAEGAIPGALNIPIRTLTANLDQIPQGQQVIVYCASGHRAALASAALHMLGYEGVRSYPAGYAGWNSAFGESGPALAGETAAIEAEEDIVAVVDGYLAGIPEGFLSVGGLDAFKDMVDIVEPILIDVREESEYGEGHIEGAINIPIRTLAQNLDKIPMDRPVMIYCASGHRAGMAVTALQVLGYENVKGFPGGWRAWTTAGEPVSTEATEAEAVGAPEVDEMVLAAVDNFLSTMPEGYYALGTVDRMTEAMDAGAVLVDVREENEYADGHIPAALSIPIRSLGARLDEIPTDTPVVVYCASGYRAALSTAALQLMGYTNVRSFPPSYAGWEAAGEPVE